MSDGEPRQRWGRRLEFFLTAVGFSVGVGDLWRFPYLVMKNGGGAFLIPIVIFVVVGAMPVVYLEMLMGQYSQSGAVSVWSVCPLFKGVGYGTIIATFLFSIYYGVIICWMLFYFIHSFFPTLPWSNCENDWNTPACIVEKTMGNATTSVVNITTTSMDSITTTLSSANITDIERKTSAEEFFIYKALRLSSGLDDMGDMNWPLVGCLLVIELFCFLCIFKGVKVTGKIVYFTVLAPFLLLLVFLVRGAILPGAERGVIFYLKPRLEKLKEPKIWAEACMQVFTSIGPGFGAMITFASYNKFSNNCLRDAIFVCLADLFTGLLGGFVIFTVLGHVSWKNDIPIEHFNESGFGLGFIAYPEAANYLPPPQLWCAMFFFMSIFLGIDSQFPNHEVVITALRDEFKKLLQINQALLTGVIIFITFLLALPMVMEGGMYMLTLVDWFAATFSVTIFALLEVIVMVYIYGMKNIEANMLEMTDRKIPWIVKLCWYAVTPILLTITVGFAVATYSPPRYGGYDYPDWAVALGWLIAATSLVPVPAVGIYRIFNTEGPLLQRIKINLRPTSDWGPKKTTSINMDIAAATFDDQEKLKVLEKKRDENGAQNPSFTTDTDEKTDSYISHL